MNSRQETWAGGPAPALLQINGHRLQIETQGPRNGPVIVLLHHGLGSIRAWKAQIPALAEAGFRVVAFDRWGYGGSDPQASLSMPFFEADLNDLETLLDQLDVPQASLVGHSDGGTIALYFAASHPARVSRLVTIAAHIYIEPKMGRGIDDVREQYEADANFREALRRIHGEKASAVFYGWYNGWRSEANLQWDLRPLLQRISCPTLVVQGLEDEHATAQHATDIAGAIPGAELWLVPEAKHMLPQDLPGTFNRKLLEFLVFRPI